MRFGPSRAAELVIAEFDETRPPIEARDLLVELTLTDPGYSNAARSEVEALAERWVGNFLERLQRELSDSNTRGQHCRFAFNESSESMLQGSCFVTPTDSDGVRAAKLSRARIPGYRRLLRELSPREFEGVCRGVLELLGCDQPVLTPRSSDQGIDFYGRLRLQGRLGRKFELPSLDLRFSTWLVGQAKHYGGKASTPDLRELVGSVELARSGVSSDDGRALEGLTLRLCDPVFYLFLTTGTLTRDATIVTERSGVIALDGDAVAALLADCEVGTVDGTLDDGELRGWVLSQLG